MQGQLQGKRAGTGKGQGKAKAVSGGAEKTPPETLEALGVKDLGVLDADGREVGPVGKSTQKPIDELREWE